MSLKGFGAGFKNSKIASRKVISDSKGNLGIDRPGNFSRPVAGTKRKK